MNQEGKDYLNQRRKFIVFELARAIRNTTKDCQDFGIPRSSLNSM